MSLFLLATPIGNLADFSTRAFEILQTAEVIAAEDTRSARRLMTAKNIPLNHRPLISYGDHNEVRMVETLRGHLAAGRSVAVLSDGGTPLISDPGYRIVQAAIELGVPVTPVPGPCAAIAALAASGLPVHGFIFRGFLPKKPGARGRILDSLVDREETLIFYESPQRLVKILPELAERFGADRAACVAREITKKHESFHRGSLGSLCALFLEGRAPAKGEVTLLIAGANAARGGRSDDENPLDDEG